MISGILLAAGASSRMGEPKALLKIGDRTFLQNIVNILHRARVEDITIVVGADADAVQSSLGWFTGRVVHNPRWCEGQLTSLLTGMDAASSESVHGFLICPVDRPLLTQDTVVKVLHGFWSSGKNIVIPTYRGKRGHPVIFGASLLPALHGLSGDCGANSLFRTLPQEILEVPTENEGILCNIDTPEDYRERILSHVAGNSIR